MSTAGNRPPLYEMPPSGPVTVEGVVERIEKPRGPDGPWRIVLADGNAAIQIVYFKAQPDWLKKLYPLGARLVVSGSGRMVRHAPADPPPGLRAAAGARRRDARASSRSTG